MRELNKQLLSNDTAAVDNLREMERDGVCDRETRSNNRRGGGDHSTRTRERGAHREEGKTRARKTAMFLRNFSLTRTGIIALARVFSFWVEYGTERHSASSSSSLSFALSHTHLFD